MIDGLRQAALVNNMVALVTFVVLALTASVALAKRATPAQQP